MPSKVTAGLGDFCAHLNEGQIILFSSIPVITANGTTFPLSYAITGLFMLIEASISA